jgi:ferric-dicitrate binding protein FerR (iron transport regulator)
MQSATELEDRDEAIRWIARLRAHDVSSNDRARFIEWIADARNRREFDALLRIWEQLGCVAQIDP